MPSPVGLILYSGSLTLNCLQTNGSGLPVFQGYDEGRSQAGGPDRRIHDQHQAIIPSYKFNCCGNITEWGVDLNPDGTRAKFDFILQVWRPSPTVNVSGCYSLVDDFSSREITVEDNPANERVARVTPSPQDQLQFQPGDVLGFYVESNGDGSSDHDNGVVVLEYDDQNSAQLFNSELVWYGYIDTLAQTSLSGNCPHPVGTNGMLSSSTHAAPVISISVSSYSCPQSVSHSVTVSVTKLIEQPQQSPITLALVSGVYYHSTHSHLNIESTIMSTTPGICHSSHCGLIAGVVVTIIIVCSSTLVTITTVIIRKHRKTSIGGPTDPGIVLTNQVYGAPERISPIVQHHLVGPDAYKTRSSHVYVGDPLRNDVHHYDTARWEQVDTETECYVYENPDAKLNQKVVVYETPRKGLFDTTGLCAPTSEERVEGHSEMQNFSTSVYSKLNDKFFVEDQIYWAPASSTSDLYSQLASKKYREIPREQIKILRVLGSGEFGKVNKALWSISGTTKEVAVKTLKPGSSENDRVRFLQEAAIMGQFNHPHVVKLYGVVTVGDPMMICLELMAKGDLRGYLETIFSNKHDNKQLKLQLLKFSRQIASGMAYLSKKAFVHRDLAARNILLDEALTCKIGDFGMARDLADDTYYTVQSKGNKIPVKWTAPEALFYKKYSTDSDVWSYGMVLFEIWSAGKKPFSEITNKEVLKKINSGYCQPPPPGCPRPIYQLMVNCWNPVHSQRPSFSKLSATLNASSGTLLEWTGDDCRVPNELGGQLSEALFLYQDLQNTYNNISYKV